MRESFPVVTGPPGPVTPRRSRAPWRALAWIVMLGALLAPPARATVFTRIDFESPGYGTPPRRLSDHFLIKAGGAWHLFYAELPNTGSPYGNRIGHAVSTDLAHWTEHAVALAPGAQPWMSHQVWAPHVLALPGGGYRMFFTGQNDLGSETIGSASSSDLDTWTLDSPDPCYVPPPGWVRWGPDFACDCRDSYVYADSGHWTMLYTCYTASVPHQPAIGMATSPDLLTWTEAGPLVIDSTSYTPTALESPSLFTANGRAELHFTRFETEMITAPTLAGPFDMTRLVAVDPKGSADEWPVDGGVQLMSRLRHDGCAPGSALIVIDTVTATSTGWTWTTSGPMPAGWTWDGDAFLNQPTYGDGPACRGQTPAAPQGVRWLGTGEPRHMPDTDIACNTPVLGIRTGWALSQPFLLQGDVLAFRAMGKNLVDSTYVALLDDCTGQELARQTGPGGNTLTPFAWSNAGRQGWRVRLKVMDRSTASDGVFGLDAIADSSITNPALPALPAVAVTTPAGGENYSPNTTVTLRWTGSSSAGIDSFGVYVSYDNFATAPVRITKRNATQFSFNWTTPAGPKFDAHIRIVAYAKNTVHGCADSPAFNIGATAGADPSALAAGAGVRLSVFGQPGPLPVLLWSAPDEGPWTLALYDVRGRRVRTLVDGATSREGRAPWDGRTDDGRVAAPGLYFARFAHGARGASAVVVRTTR